MRATRVRSKNFRCITEGEANEFPSAASAAGSAWKFSRSMRPQQPTDGILLVTASLTAPFVARVPLAAGAIAHSFSGSFSVGFGLHRAPETPWMGWIQPSRSSEAVYSWRGYIAASM